MSIILVEKQEQVAIVTINRPNALNALNREVIASLSQEIQFLEKEDSIRCIILTGSGEKAFVAGADIKEFSNFSPQEGEALSKKGQEQLFDVIENLKKPVIAAINGYALGGGLELAMACHIRIASENAKLGLPEVTLGLIPGYGGTQRLSNLVGKGMANQMIFSAEMITAEKAQQIGLVNNVVSYQDLLPTTSKLANKIARNSPMAVSNAIEAVNKAGTKKGFAKEQKLFGELFQSKDFQEGVNAFLEKRKPIF